jgi:hypothetical protein
MLLDPAEILLALEAADDSQLLLHVANDRAHVDLVRLSREAESAVLAADGFEISSLSQFMHDLHHVALRDVEMRDDFGNRGKPLALETDIYEDAKRIVGAESQAHARCPIVGV